MPRLREIFAPDEEGLVRRHDGKTTQVGNNKKKTVLTLCCAKFDRET